VAAEDMLHELVQGRWTGPMQEGLGGKRTCCSEALNPANTERQAVSSTNLSPFTGFKPGRQCWYNREQSTRLQDTAVLATALGFGCS